ncbi:MAG: DUF1553 domain-containing protein [Planctomycetes bacterium]|nr:DUF1553 domain-containing protein [Planctomycetota bacterium]MCP4770265.1 DUF1553 domain-containing protein [Planctomycetota bacterium]MCP4860587.1 DUF1553 domain-containing protein [Planctomycetota bacterium]
MSLRAVVILLTVAISSPSLAAQEPQRPVDFQSEVRPLISDRCYQCHGPDADGRKADLRLDIREGATVDLGGNQAIKPGVPEESELVRRIQLPAADEDHMPPLDSNLTLTSEEIDLLTRWVAEGAIYTPHWSFVPVQVNAHPGAIEGKWGSDPLDAFILARLHNAGLQPVKEAAPEVWLRRVTFALTGLPPTPEEIKAFLANPSEDAYEATVDRLLASPRFGERFAQIWLDLARYADTHGYQSDVARRVWPYRDWVIDSFNRNQPFSEFLTEQLAGDLLPEPTPEQRLATAFNRLHRQTNEGGSVEEEFRVEYVADRVQTMGTAFLGLTMECARCHDHRFDPILQSDFYQLSAFFDNIDESGLYSHFTSATPTPTMGLPNDQQARQLAELQEEVETREAVHAQLEADARGRFESLAANDGLPAPPTTAPVPTDFYDFEDDIADGFTNLQEDANPATVAVGPVAIAGRFANASSGAVLLNGDGGIRFPGSGTFTRSDPFTISMWLQVPAEMERAVLLHRSRAWTDAASQGWQMMIEDGSFTAALIHFWPGDAIGVRCKDKAPIGEWVHLSMSYDGSSRAAGLHLYVNGRAAELEVVRNHLEHGITGGGPGAPTLGERFRDRGFAGGKVDEVAFFDRQLSAQELALLAGREPQPADALEFELLTNDGALAAHRGTLKEARLKRDQMLDAIPTMMVMEEMAGSRKTYLLKRGSYEMQAEELSPGTPEAVFAFPTNLTQDRLGLSQWLLMEENPLTARVAVNRLWQAVFGRGLVATSEDFGSQGELPSHPLLLDRLAADYRASGWDRKAMLKRLVLSSTYRQSSTISEQRRSMDPQNYLWSRGPIYRLPAEMVRDGVLAASGLLVEKIGGPSVKPYQPTGLWKEKSGQTYVADKGEGLYRRSLYTFWKRTSPPPSMMLFDAAKRDVCLPRRESTSTPLQALVVWNAPQFVEASRILAERLLSKADGAAIDETRINDLFLLLAGRAPTAEEAQVLLNFLNDQRTTFADDLEGAKALLGVGEQASAALDSEATTDHSIIEHAAWSLTCSVLMSSDPYLMLR